MRWGAGEWKVGTECVRQLCDIFGRENVYVELQRHFDRAEEARNHAAVEIARKLHLPLVATNGVCYALPEQREVLDVFTCIRQSPHARNRGAVAGAQFGTIFEIAGGDGAFICGSSRGHRQYAAGFRAPAIRFERFGVRVSEVSGAGREIAGAFSARARRWKG